MVLSRTQLTAVVALTAGFVLVYWQVLVRLVDAWTNDGNYSHGFLIIPLAAYLAWERRAKLLETAVQPSWFGILVFAGGIMLLLAGLLGSESWPKRPPSAPEAPPLVSVCESVWTTFGVHAMHTFSTLIGPLCNGSGER